MKDSIKLEDEATRKPDIGNTVRAHFFLKYFPNIFFCIPLKGILFIHQVLLIIGTFLIVTSPSCHLGTHSSPNNLAELNIKPRNVSILDPAPPYIHHLGTHSSPNNLHTNAPPLSHARRCEENKIFLTL